MYKEDHQNDKAVFAFCKYLEVNKGKDAGGAQRVQDETKGLNASCDAKKAPAPKPKKPAKK
jgi:hypothetical protein